MALVLDSMALLESNYPRSSLEQIKSNSTLLQPQSITFEIQDENMVNVDNLPSKNPSQIMHRQKIISHSTTLQEMTPRNSVESVSTSDSIPTDWIKVQAKRKDIRRKRRPNESQADYEKRIKMLEYQLERNARLSQEEREQQRLRARAYYYEKKAKSMIANGQDKRTGKTRKCLRQLKKFVEKINEPQRYWQLMGQSKKQNKSKDTKHQVKTKKRTYNKSGRY